MPESQIEPDASPKQSAPCTSGSFLPCLAAAPLLVPGPWQVGTVLATGRFGWPSEPAKRWLSIAARSGTAPHRESLPGSLDFPLKFAGFHWTLPLLEVTEGTCRQPRTMPWHMCVPHLRKAQSAASLRIAMHGFASQSPSSKNGGALSAHDAVTACLRQCRAVYLIFLLRGTALQLALGIGILRVLGYCSSRAGMHSVYFTIGSPRWHSGPQKRSLS